MPVGETVEPVVMPSGEVAPMLGVGLTIPLTCALATLQATSVGKIAASNTTLRLILRFAASSFGAWLSDIGQSRIEVARKARIGLLLLLRLFLFAGKWTTRSACSIK
jgi:hypothetical protein